MHFLSFPLTLTNMTEHPAFNVVPSNEAMSGIHWRGQPVEAMSRSTMLAFIADLHGQIARQASNHSTDAYFRNGRARLRAMQRKDTQPSVMRDTRASLVNLDL